MIRTLLIVLVFACSVQAQYSGGSAGGSFSFRAYSGGSAGGQPTMYAAPSGGSAGGYGRYQAYAAAPAYQAYAPIRYLPVRRAIYVRGPVETYVAAPSHSLGLSFRIGFDY